MSSEPDAISLRLTANHVSLIWTGLNEVAKSYSAWQSKKVPAFSYPFKLLDPYRELNRGTYNSEFMKLILGVWKRMRSKVNSGGRFRMNTIEIRAAILGVRINMDSFRYRKNARRKHRRKPERKLSVLEKRERELEDASQKRLKAQSDRAIRALERHLKRANYWLRKPLSRVEYDQFMETWRAHVRFIRMHFAYFKPWRLCLRVGMKTAYQQVLDELTAVAMMGIQREGYQLPDPVQLRKIMRHYVAYTRRERLPYQISYMLNHAKATGAGRLLCRFVEERLNLVEVEE